MAATTPAPGGELPGDPDAAIRQLYSHYAKALHGYVEQSAALNAAYSCS